MSAALMLHGHTLLIPVAGVTPAGYTGHDHHRHYIRHSRSSTWFYLLLNSHYIQEECSSLSLVSYKSYHSLSTITPVFPLFLAALLILDSSPQLATTCGTCRTSRYSSGLSQALQQSTPHLEAFIFWLVVPSKLNQYDLPMSVFFSYTANNWKATFSRLFLTTILIAF